MKTRFFAMGLITLAALVSSCNKNEDIAGKKVDENGSFSLLAVPEEVKTTNDNMKTAWSKDDKVAVFHSLEGDAAFVNDSCFTITEANLADNKFVGKLKGDPLDPEEAYDWRLIYPFDKRYNSPKSQSYYFTIGNEYNKSQAIEAAGSMAHLAGTTFPIWGYANSVQGKDVAVTMRNVASVLAITVKNSTTDPLAPSQISFTAPVDTIVGSFYINISGDEPSFKAISTKSAKTVNAYVKTPFAIGTGETAVFYVGIKPFTAKSGQTLKLSVNGFEKSVTLTSDLVFAPGKIKTVNFDFNAPTGAGIKDIKTAVNTGTSSNRASYRVKLTDAVVTYVNGDNYFIEDGSDAIMLYCPSEKDLDNKLKVGDKINGLVYGTGYLYNNLPEIVTMDHSLATVTSGATIPETAITLSELTGDNYTNYLSKRVKLTGVSVTKTCYGSVANSDRQGEISQNSSTCMLFAQLKDSTIFVPKGSAGDVIVYPTIYGTTKELGIWDNTHFTYTTIGTVVKFAKAEYTLKVGESATAIVATTNSTGTVAYESSNTAVATVDASGNVTPLSVGTTTITASVAATGKYLAGSATCTVTVESATSTKVTYILNPTGVTGSGSSKSVTDTDPVLTFTANKGGAGTAPGYYNSCIRLYQKGASSEYGGYLEITAASGYKIQSVIFTAGTTYSSTKVKTSVDGGTTLSAESSLAAGGTVTLNSISTDNVRIYCLGTDSKTRLDIAQIKVVYDVKQ